MPVSLADGIEIARIEAVDISGQEQAFGLGQGGDGQILGLLGDLAQMFAAAIQRRLDGRNASTRHLTWPLHLSYWVYLIVLLAVAAAICLVPETVENPRRHLRELSLAPRLGVPQEIRLPFVPPAVTGFVIFAMIGFYAALIPNLLSESLHQTSPTVSGSIVCELFVVAAISVVLTRHVDSRIAMLSALALLPPSLWLLIGAQFWGSMPLLLATTALSGVAASLGYRGSLEVVNGIAPPEQRSEVVSSYLVALYMGNSLPVIGIGLLKAAAGSGLAHIVFAAVITVLAGIAGVIAIKAGRKVA
jgi:hypothetical protein